MYRLLALDLDGTMLNPDKMITPKTRSSIQQLISAEVNVTIASGRFPASVWSHAKEVSMNFPLVALNGAVTVDPLTGQLLDGVALKIEDMLFMLDIIQQEEAYIHFYGYNVLYVQEINDINRNWAINNRVNRPELDSFEERDELDAIEADLIRFVEVGKDFRTFVNQMPGMLFKAAVICTDHDSRENLFRTLEESGLFQCTRTGSLRFDVNSAGVSKRGALERLCHAHQIEREQVAAAGDYDNDLDMLQWAGLGIAMGNAELHVKEIANVVTASNAEDGVAQAIHTFLL
ncbi:Cof-type HAD-IIB family hydrolase [Paenibacillus sp. FSL L8-0435]|uniref:Cof-type HAD-IIB family hydrolase n=1 Tax=Paenibacillus TaxID=44249 RepID=UPI001C8ECC31|nr:Cof-type HAD-IIB family hydrolase [Paenibacillus xylanexedens]MBY0116763.1 HAD family phosphatase [Paenibacillus xylanexedens]